MTSWLSSFRRAVAIAFAATTATWMWLLRRGSWQLEFEEVYQLFRFGSPR